MLLEAVVRDITQRGDVARQLGERPEAVMQLTEYGRQIMTISEMGISILPVSFGLWAAGIRYQQCYGLLTNDSVVIAACIENNCHNLASGDAAFRKVREIQLYEPSDIG
jgi:predicted nucleic acid-binding protein